ncbi:hypothetical protein ACIQJT_04955 [Streptomyces sp. NPDC091972]
MGAIGLLLGLAASALAGRGTRRGEERGPSTSYGTGPELTYRVAHRGE